MKHFFVLFSVWSSVSQAADASQSKFGEFYPVSLFEAPAATVAVKNDEDAEPSGGDSSLGKPPESFERLRSRLHQDGSLLGDALAAFDREYADLRVRSASTTARDVELAAKGLRTLASYARKLHAQDQAAAEALMAQINTRLQPLLEEFKPNAPYRRVFVNLPPSNLISAMNSEAGGDPAIPRDSAENQANNLYNIRQSALRSFFIGMKRLRAFYPELKSLDARIDAVDDPRLDEMRRSSLK